MVAINYDGITQAIRKWICIFVVVSLGCYFCLYTYAAKIEPNWIEIVPLELTIERLPPAFNNFKIVQISDLHVNRFMPESRLARAINLVNRQHPDAIAITGDIITKYRYLNGRKLHDCLQKLKAKDGIFAVLGNHDLKGNQTKKLKRVLQKSQINNLENQVIILQRGKEKLAFAGIDDPYWGKPDLPGVIAKLPAKIAAILLVHEPDYLQQSARTHKFFLQLSGHSHGGQIRFPFLDPLVLPLGGQKYYLGLNQLGDTWEYTNRGLGMTGMSFRFNSRPEITVITLHSI